MHTPNCPCTSRVIYILAILFSAVLFSSCGAEIKASMDWADQAEAGGSAVTPIHKINANIGVYFDNVMALSGITSAEPFDAKEASGGRFGIGGGLEFIGKGAKYSAVNGGGSVGLNYLELPIYVTYHYPVSPDSKLFGGLGPYLAYGIGGKSKFGSFSTSSFGENNGGYKRFDAGLALEAGYKYKEASFSLSYDLGLANVAYASQDITAKNRSFGINIGYSLEALFGKK
jgi:Outer membrane protein beta-barrel domain